MENRDSKKAMKMFEDNKIQDIEEAIALNYIQKYPHLAKMQANAFADAPIRTDGYPHLDDFLKQQTMR